MWIQGESQCHKQSAWRKSSSYGGMVSHLLWPLLQSPWWWTKKAKRKKTVQSNQSCRPVKTKINIRYPPMQIKHLFHCCGTRCQNIGFKLPLATGRHDCGVQSYQSCRQQAGSHLPCPLCRQPTLLCSLPPASHKSKGAMPLLLYTEQSVGLQPRYICFYSACVKTNIKQLIFSTTI